MNSTYTDDREIACNRSQPPDNNNQTSNSLFNTRLPFAKLASVFGIPCLIAVAAIDPGNLEVDLQAGHHLRYSLIWVVLFSSVAGCILQALAAHLTICSGKPLASLFSTVYRAQPLLSYSIFTVAEISVIAFDVAEVVGTALALRLLFNFPLWVGMILSALDTMLVLVLQRQGLNSVQIVIQLLLFLLSACLFYEFCLSRPNLFSMFHGAVIPSLGSQPREGAMLAVGILGSVVMSHNLFLHSWLVHSRTNAEHSISLSMPYPLRATQSRRIIDETSRYATIEAAAIFFATFLINTCVITITAALPKSILESLPDIGLQEAGALLRRVFGSEFASTAWAIALLCSGHAATVTGALASQAVCEGFLNIRDDRSYLVVMATRAVAILPALAVALIAGEASADRLIVLSQVIISLALPFTAIPMFKALVAIDRINEGNIINRKMLVAGHIACVLLITANVYVFYDMVYQIHELMGNFSAFLTTCVGIFSVFLFWKLIVTPVQLPDSSTEEWAADAGEMQSLIFRPKSTPSP